MSLLGAGLDFDDPIDTFGQLYITDGGRWYQRRSIPELDALYNQQKSEQDFDKRRELVWEMDTIATNDAGYLILHWWQFNRVQWDFVKGLTSTASARTTNARMIYTWLDLPEADRTSR
jgi:ABC-type transport system substrate-binding protein